MGIFRLLVYGALLWLLYRLIRGFLPASRPAPSGPAPSGGRLDGGELVQDPVCGVYVPKTTALRNAAGEYFCSESCRDARGRR
jgi:hypothetical protein